MLTTRQRFRRIDVPTWLQRAAVVLALLWLGPTQASDAVPWSGLAPEQQRLLAPLRERWDSLPAQNQEAIKSALSETFLRWWASWQKQNAEAIEDAPRPRGRSRRRPGAWWPRSGRRPACRASPGARAGSRG